MKKPHTDIEKMVEKFNWYFEETDWQEMAGDVLVSINPEEWIRQALTSAYEKGREETIKAVDEVPRCFATHKDGSKSICVLQHSLETHGLTNRKKDEYLQALKNN